MENNVNTTFLHLLVLVLLLCLATAASSTTSSFALKKEVHGKEDDDNCVYTVYVRTGSIWKGGTDSIISLELEGADGSGVLITDLESWGGLMGPGHDYYERGNLDVFSGMGPCMGSPPCRMNLTSDGSGPHHGWYCNYVEVTVTGPHMGCAQRRFDVEQWLATDASPYQLYAARDECPAEAKKERLAAGGGGGSSGRRGARGALRAAALAGV